MSTHDYEDQKGSFLYFEDGILGCSVYSYRIDSFGELDLSKQETRKFYEAMKEYYERRL